MSGVTPNGIRYPDGATKAKNLGAELAQMAGDLDDYVTQQASTTDLGLANKIRDRNSAVSGALHELMPDMVEDAVASSTAVQEGAATAVANAANIELAGRGLIEGDNQPTFANLRLPDLHPGSFPTPDVFPNPDMFPGGEYIPGALPAEVPKLDEDGNVYDIHLPEDLVRTDAGGHIPYSVIPPNLTSQINALQETVDDLAPLPPPARWSPDVWVASEGVRMPIPTHDGSGQAVHPSVMRTPLGSPYRWAMAVTPYPARTTEHEDPNFVASQDGVNWEVPSGTPVPLDDSGGGGEGYNSDTNLVYHDGRWIVFWRHALPASGGDPAQVTIWKREAPSMNGPWTDREEVITQPGLGLLSPELVWTGAEWRMYTVRTTGTEGFLEYRTANDLTGPWSAAVATDLAVPVGAGDLWHAEIRLFGGWWYALAQTRETGGNGGGDLYLASSVDGVTWDTATEPLLPRVGTQHTYLYKGSLVPYQRQGQWAWRLFYTGFNTTPSAQSWLYYTDLEEA